VLKAISELDPFGSEQKQFRFVEIDGSCMDDE
jgi:hypothetical protein